MLSRLAIVLALLSCLSCSASHVKTRSGNSDAWPPNNLESPNLSGGKLITIERSLPERKDVPENTPNTPAVRSSIVVPKDATFRDGVVVEFPNGFGFSYTFRRIGRPTAQRMAHLLELAKSGDSKNMIVFKPWIARLSPYDPSKPENGATTLSGTSADGYDIEMFMSTKGNVLVDPKEQRRIIAWVLSSIKDVDQ